MACLVPQFKCPSSSFVKAKDQVCFRSQCVVSQMISVIDMEQIQISSSVVPPSSLAISAVTPLTYLGTISSSMKMSSEVAFPREALLTDEEVLVVAAAAEAIALARAAVEVAKDAARMTGNIPSLRSEKPENFSSEADILRLERVRLSNMEHVGTVDQSIKPDLKPDGETQHSSGDKDISDELQHMPYSKSTTVRSDRQSERRARRTRAAQKSAASVISVKSVSSSRKKRTVVQEIDYSDPLRYLRSTTSTSKLLTASDELELSKGIQDLLKLEKLQEELAERSGGEPTFAQWAAAAGMDRKTLRKRLNYGILCKDKMIKSNIRLVISIAKNYQGVGMNLQDLVQEGCRGLVKGAEKFDASKGFKFSTYAHWWIKQAVRRSLSDQSRTIRLPVHMVEATYRVREARKQLYSENGRYPDNKEVAEATGLSMRRLTAVMLTPKAPRSLDQKIGINMNLKPSDVISHPDAETTEDVLIKQLMKQDLYEVLDSLSQREKQVVVMRFGLDDGRMKTLQEIGEVMSISRERVRQIESCAFRKLKSSGRFLIWLAKKFPEPRNYLGLEIRQKLVQRSQFWVKDLDLKNICFMFANATVSFDQLVSTYPGSLTLVSILCPDPHFKKRHHKRRVVQEPLVDSILDNLVTGGQVFMQSDVLEVAHDMRNQFDARSDVLMHADAFDHPNYLCDSHGWLLHNPMGIRTEREIHAELEGAKIYRRMYQKQKHHSPIS